MVGVPKESLRVVGEGWHTNLLEAYAPYAPMKKNPVWGVSLLKDPFTT